MDRDLPAAPLRGATPRPLDGRAQHVQPRRGARILRRAAKLAASALGLLVLALGALVALEWTWFRRVATFPARPIGSVEWYQPRELVRGGDGAELPLAAQAALPAEALERAAGWCAERRSLALLVVHRGQIAFERYWSGHGRDALAIGMSMSKTLVALLVGIALEEGQLDSLDAPAARWLTEWAGDERARISLRQLLAMCSGLGGARHGDDPTSEIGYMFLGDDSVAIVAGARLAEEPGVRFEYHSIATQALAVVLERATGERFADYLSERLWQPIGAADAAVWLDREGGQAKAFCGVIARARDWARVGLLIAEGGRAGGRQVVPADFVAAMGEPSVLEPDYGLHLWLGRGGIRWREAEHREPFVARDLVWLDGKHAQRVYVFPSLELVIVRIGERPADWDDAFLPNLLARALGDR